MRLSEVSIGKDAIIKAVNCEQVSLRKHILDMGLTPGTEVTLVKVAPLGDPLEIMVRGYELTLRKDDALKIEVDDVHDAHEKCYLYNIKRDSKHPGVGEQKYKVIKRGDELTEKDVISFGLLGNQNCGKTTLFNALTGMNQHVGNFPGVTVDRKDGVIKEHPNTNVTDLPGIYSLSPYSSEEIVTREFLLDQRPKGIINIIDATNIERNLYLTMQLIELDIPMVLALNMMDEVRQNGGTIMINRLEELLGIPVVPISASKGEGIEELITHAIHVAKHRERPGRMDFCDENGEDAGAVHRCIHGIIHLIEDHAKKAKLPVRFAATKLVEDDPIIKEQLMLDDNETDMIEHIILQMEEESGRDRQAALADMRFDFISDVCKETVVKPKESIEHKRSQRIDKVLTGKWTAIPAFALIMALTFWVTFGPIGTFFSDLIEKGVDCLSNLVDKGLTSYGINEVIHSLIIDGIFAGVGAVLSFLPIIVILFFFLSIIEDCGYMARIAFVMDKLLRKIGLSGRSFVPMLIGFGCSVPAIMATRTLPSERDRKMTVLLTPFMSCSAKLPIYALFSSLFFKEHAVIAMISMYFIGIFVGILMALLLKKTTFKGEPVPFVMELPNYRLPSAKSVLRLIGEKAKDFITKAFTIIFIASIVIWFLQSFDSRLNIVSDSKDSLLASLGGLLAPIFKPLGLGDWRISTALVTGFAAKESVVSTLTVLGGGTDLIATIFTPLTAFVMMVFCLLYTPCVAAVAAVKKELGTKYSLIVVFVQCVLAYIVALIVNIMGSLLF